MKLFPFLSLRYTILLMFCVFTLFYGVYNYYSSLNIYERHAREEAMEVVEAVSQKLVIDLERDFRNNDIETATIDLKTFSLLKDVDMAILTDQKGNTITATLLGLKGKEVSSILDKYFAEDKAVISGQISWMATSLTPKIFLSSRGDAVIAVYPVLEGEASIGALIVRYDIMRNVKEHAEKAVVQTFTSSIVLLLFILALWVFITIFLTNRVADIAGSIRRFGSGDISVRVGDMGRDELGVIATELDRMADNIVRNNLLLEESHARLVEAQRIGKFGSWEMDITTQDIVCSMEVYFICGVDPLVFQPTVSSFLSLIHPDDRQMVSDTLNDSISNRTRFDVTHRILMGINNELRFVHQVAEVINAADGTPVRMIGTIQDITERKQAEEALKRNEEKFRSLYDALPVMYFTVSADGIVLSMNNFAVDELGYTKEELIGRPVVDIFYEEDKSKVLKEAADCLRSMGTLMEWELRKVHKKGHVVWVHETARAIYDTDGKPVILIACEDITERKTAEEAVKESEHRLKSIIDTSPMPMGIADGAGNITYINRQFTELFGYTRDDIPSVNDWFIKAYPDEGYRNHIVPEWVSSLEDNKRTGAPIPTIEVDITAKSGVVRTTLLSTAVVGSDAFVILNDITERKKAEKEILKLNRVYRTLSGCNEALVHARDEASLLSDICRIIVEQGGYRMAWVGYRQYDENKTIKPMAEAGYEEGYLENIRTSWGDNELGRGPTGTAIRTGEISVNKDILTNPLMLPWRGEAIKRGYASSVSLPLKDNEEVFASLTLYAAEPDAFNDEEIKLLRELAADLAYGIVTQRTLIERQEAEEALEQSERYLRTIIETSPMPMGSVNKEGQITLLNDAFVRTFGYTIEDIHHVEMWFTRAYPDKTYREKIVAEWMRSIEEFARSGTPIPVLEVMITAKDASTHIVELYTTHLESETFVIFHDITEKKHFEETIRHQNEELEQKVKERTSQLESINKELEAFTYSVSHDLRAPLRSIDGFSAVVMEDYGSKLGDEGKEYLQRVRKAAEKMSHLIDDLLSLSRLTRGELNKTPVNISNIAANVIKTLREADPLRAIDVTIAEGMNDSADPRLMDIVLTNLLNNAWKFTSKKEKARVEFGHMEKDGKTVYYVRDNGAGFDMNYATKMFQPFQRMHTEEEFPGTGIGLATVYRIIKKHGGDIWAEGEVGKGATFYFTLGQ